MSATFFGGFRAALAFQPRRFPGHSAVLILAFAGQSALGAEPLLVQHDLTQPATLMRTIPAATVKSRLFVGTSLETPARDETAWTSTTQAARVTAASPRPHAFHSTPAAKGEVLGRLPLAVSTRSQWAPTSSHSLTSTSAKPAAPSAAHLQSLHQPAEQSAANYAPSHRSTNGFARAMPALLGTTAHATGDADRSVFVSQATLNPASFSAAGGATPFTAEVSQQPWSPAPTR
ncbi:hypothetical protein [Lacipirellula parvula]|uniref:Uncharacterized protein n=1 Tax=Lacipirellula parvula TaxID=2650471 RepID=A0A5K7XA62_9BACT|nr:hypothetical protein [Lacipirellula parvula]BBO33594.1 hypothetical protein PLANPX_3206 [Lacipirellula parvula]